MRRRQCEFEIFALGRGVVSVPNGETSGCFRRPINSYVIAFQYGLKTTTKIDKLMSFLCMIINCFRNNLFLSRNIGVDYSRRRTVF